MPKTRLRCPLCKTDSSHDILFTSRPNWGTAEKRKYDVVQCSNCKMLGLRETIKRHDTDTVEVKQYPGSLSRDRPVAVDGNFLWNDVYDAFESGHYQLAAMGARAVIEAHMASRVGDRGGFQKTLDAFNRDGNLSGSQYDSLKALIEVGNASTHRGFEPSRTDVEGLLDILENVIISNDYHPMVVSLLRDTVERSAPKRKR